MTTSPFTKVAPGGPVLNAVQGGEEWRSSDSPP